MPDHNKAGRPVTLTPEIRREQLRTGKLTYRARERKAGKVRLDVTVLAPNKAALEAYRDLHGYDNLGDALDAILASISVARET